MYKLHLRLQRSHLLSASPHCARAPHQIRSPLIIRAASGGIGDFFKKDDSKQDAARKALQDAFKGTKNPFEAEEKRREKEAASGGGSGNGGTGSGGGGGGGGFGGFNFDDFNNKFRKWLRNTLRAFAATLLFVGFILLFTLWRPFLALVTKLIRMILRLDGNSRAQLAAGPAVAPDFEKTDGLGNVEESIISKYGGADAGADEESGSDDSESDE